MDRLTEITWSQAEGAEQIALRHDDGEGATWSVIWTGGLPPTYWRLDEDAVEPEPIQRGDLPPAVRSRLEVATEDLARRLAMVRGVLG
jgi:hypothetical protein